jgi:hypothetical protein
MNICKICEAEIIFVEKYEFINKEYVTCLIGHEYWRNKNES